MDVKEPVTSFVTSSEAFASPASRFKIANFEKCPAIIAPPPIPPTRLAGERPLSGRQVASQLVVPQGQQPLGVPFSNLLRRDAIIQVALPVVKALLRRPGVSVDGFISHRCCGKARTRISLLRVCVYKAACK